MKYLWTCLSLVLWFLGAGTAIREATIFPNETLYDEDMSPEYEDFYDLDSSNSTSDLDSRESANDEECKETPTMFSFLRGVHGENRKLPIVKQVPDLNHTMLIVDHLANLTATLLNIQLNKQQLAIMFELFYEIQVSDQCLVSLARLVRAISQRQIWALKFLDSMGKIPTGVMEGTSSHFGEFDECLEIVEPTDEHVPLHGQYCLAKFILPYPVSPKTDFDYGTSSNRHLTTVINILKAHSMDNYLTVNKMVQLLNNQNGVTFRFGICFPSMCSANEFESLLNQVLYPITRMPIELMPDCYQKPSTVQFDRFQIAAIAILTTLVSMNLLCTTLDLFVYGRYRTFSTSDPLKPLKSSPPLIECFSLIQNIKTFFDVRHSATDFITIDVIRFLMMINVCIDHMFMFAPFMSFMAFKRTLNSVVDKVYYYNKYFFARNVLFVDTLFMITGLLLSINLLRQMDKNRKFHHYGMFIVKKWLKYSLPMSAVMLLFWILPLTGDGPIWNTGMKLLVTSCKNPNSILSNFMFYSNYHIDQNHTVFNFSSQFSLCNPPTWIISAMFQLQLFGLIFVYLLNRCPRYGLMASGLLVLFGSYAAISTSQLLGVNKMFEHANISSLELTTKAFVSFHTGISQYIGAFFIGILTGYIINRHLSGYKLEITKYEPSIWTISLSCVILVIVWFNKSNQLSYVSMLMWFSVGKIISSLSVAWFLYAISTGRALLIERVLSCSMFHVLSRLTLSVYLLHFIPMSHRLFSIRDTYVMSYKTLAEYLMLDLIETLIMAVFFHLLIEKPFSNLFTWFFDSSSKPEVVRAHDRHSPLCSQFSNSSCFSSCTAISTITDSTIDSLPEFLDHSPDSKRPSFSSHKMDVFF